MRILAICAAVALISFTSGVTPAGAEEDSAAAAKTAAADKGETEKDATAGESEGETVKTKSGLQITELTAGTGEHPQADSKIKIHYHGTLKNGKVFDSSVDRGEPATFPLNRLIPCWKEGIPMMRVGGKSRLVCPPKIAYGKKGAGKIPKNATITFEVELLEIVK